VLDGVFRVFVIIRNTTMCIRIKLKLMDLVHKGSVRASQSTQLVIFIKISWRLPCGAVMAVYCVRFIRNARMCCVDNTQSFKALIENLYVLFGDNMRMV